MRGEKEGKRERERERERGRGARKSFKRPSYQSGDIPCGPISKVWPIFQILKNGSISTHKLYVIVTHEVTLHNLIMLLNIYQLRT